MLRTSSQQLDWACVGCSQQGDLQPHTHKCSQSVSLTKPGSGCAVGENVFCGIKD